MTDRPPVSLVILAWNAWDETQGCLDSLLPTLAAHDEVIVVDNGSSDATPEQLATYPWVRVVRNEENRGFAAGCNQGAEIATREILVFLNNDTVLAGSWIEPLVEPLASEAVVACGPRSNFVSGPQLVAQPGYAAGDHEGLARFVAAWRTAHGTSVSEVRRLVGFCLAVRASSFRALGGFDEGYEVGGYEDDDLCRRLAEAGGSLVIAHGSYVHHTGHRTFDANEVDWAAQELRNRERYLEKFEPASPLFAPAPHRTLVPGQALPAPVPAPSDVLVLGQAVSLLAAGEPERAGELALSLARDARAVERLLPEIVDVLVRCGRPLDALVALVEPAGLRPFLGRVLALDARHADAVLEACALAMPEELAVLAAAASLAARLPVDRAIVWSARLRAAGLADACPLVAEVATARSRLDRARAAAAAVQLFGDERGRARLAAVLALAAPSERAVIAAEVAAICPDLELGPRRAVPAANDPGRRAREATDGLRRSPAAPSVPSFVIHAPWPYSHRSAGVRALYVLGDGLRGRGAEVAIEPLPCGLVADPDPYVLPLASTWSAEEVEEAVHVYPEVVSGNPAGARKVARWYLGPPRYPSAGRELEVAWLPHLKPGADRLLVNVIDLDVFTPRAAGRSGALVWFGKRPVRGVEMPAGFREITATWPASRAELAEELRRAELVVSYDAFSSVVLEATLCGTPVLLAGGSATEFPEDSVFGSLGIATDPSGLARARSELPEARAHYLRLCEAMAGDVDRFLERAAALAS